MRILVLNERDLSSPLSGGAEVHVHEVFRRIASRGADVTLVSHRFAGSAAAEHRDGMTILRIGWGEVAHYPSAAAWCARETRAGRFDAVVELLTRGIYFTPCVSAAPVLAVCHHLVGLNAFLQASWPVAAAQWLGERAIPWVYRRTPWIAISPSTRDDLVARGIPREQVRIVDVGCSESALSPKPIRDREPVLVYVGRLVRYKRIEVLLRAAARLVPRFPDLRVDVVGEGPERRRLEREARRRGIAERTRFHGFLDAEHRDRRLAAARVAVMPSNLEGFGLTVLEAAALGTPVVASNAPGLRDAVQDGWTGLLARTGDDADFASRIGRLLEDDRLAERMSAAARAWSHRFDWDEAARGVEASLEELIAR